MSRAGFAVTAIGLLGAVSVVAAGMTFGASLAPVARAAPVAVAPVPVAAPTGTATTTRKIDGKHLRLRVTPSRGLPAYRAQVTVAGAGFDTDQLWVAVCQDDGDAPAELSHCIGGAIPDQNATSAWGVVTDDGSSPYPGPVAASWAKHGTFRLTLQLPVAAGQDADCLSTRGAVYTRSSNGDDRRWDMRVPIGFAVPP